MGLSGRVGQAVSEKFEELLARALLQRQQEEQAARQARAQDLDERQFTESTRRFDLGTKADEEDRQIKRALLALDLTEREQRSDQEAADRRQKANRLGVLQMAGAGVRSGAINPRSRQGMEELGALQLEAGDDQGIQTFSPPTDEEADAQKLKTFEEQERIRAKYAREPQGREPQYQWVRDKDGQIRERIRGQSQPGDVPHDPVATRQSAGGSDAANDYTTERAYRTVQSVNELEQKVSNWTTGPGSLLNRVPGTDATDFAAELDTLKASIAFWELSAMRAASKTGGALGQVSDRETALLSSALGALDVRQSPANIRSQLRKIRESVQRWNMARSGGGRTTTPAVGAPPGASVPPAEIVFERDAEGRLVRKP